MNFKELSIEELEARKAAIDIEKDDENADLEALLEEIRGINEELETRKNDEKHRVEIRKAVAEGAGVTTRTIEPVVETKEKEMTNEEIRSSKAYIDAFANYIKTGKDEECRALLTVNASGTVPVPTIVEERVRTAWQKNSLMSLVRKTYFKGNLQVGFERAADAAVVHTEGSPAPSEETLTLGIVTLTPASIKKWIRISDEALDLGGEEFLFYVYDELAYQIAKKAQSELIAKITALTASATSTAVGVGIISSGTPTVGLVASAIGELSDDAANPVLVMNKATWAQFKAAQYAANYSVDPFEGLPVHFDNTMPVYNSATTSGTWLIVGDFGVGAQANFPNGDEVTLKYDDLTYAENDLVKIVGREYIGLGIVGDHAFCKVTFE